ncbi:PREDICTED: bromodomain and WD repeat-containing protein 3 isoform X1 [Theobroma cacao]|uniref:Bromodomain and WD repeat-containing protein 3 isoform X1 n=1 Tax=Theobroma cacao TaxID=3641 RepID=A0AB32VS75_THECC|nr:PREDICTED: bromodomain and WD repeat-containing protein 3 isoform X1 [Theobroma cacao]
MDWKCSSSAGASSLCKAPLNVSTTMPEKALVEQQRRVTDHAAKTNVDIDLREIYFLIMQFLSAGPCQRTFEQLSNELLEHQLLPRRYHAWFSRSGAHSGNKNDDGISFPLSYNNLVERYPHIEKDHLIKLLKQLLCTLCGEVVGDAHAPNAADVPTLLGSGSFSLLNSDSSVGNRQGKPIPAYLRWPHMQADQVRGLSIREIGGGFRKHHRAPSVRSACYAIAKPSTMVQKMQNIKKLRGHRNAVYCAIFDRSGRYVITGSDDRLVKIWSMETAFCLASCRGHEGDITDLAVSSNNALVASASNDFVIRVWRLPDGLPVSVLRGHTGAVTAIAFSPRPAFAFQLLSSSDDGTCRIWDARFSHCSPQIYLPKPSEAVTGRSNFPSNNGPSSSNVPQNHQILCCAFNVNGTVFVTGSSDTFARVWSACKPSTDDSQQPVHELDVLAGHENDVNYVQFSGCAVPSRSSMSDTKEENVPKFKNSWFCQDNIVTCSRDGSAIIWIPRSRRSHGKVGRWTKAYHLKVPPPPLPPQPPRGGPRQRFLPTPRGVNMIVWSLDNRFVLAAIMDCRICVWNAVDGSLVHSLTGHVASSYVLDVHPFNPRIAMSAGYDGKTIVWDIWEGIPIRIYEIGRFKLVDGKFSPDGTSIVLSDEVGQIYLLNTGQGESQKDAKYDQFFLGDYRPLIWDFGGNALDQETQLPPHRRNMQDLICDASMIPYPEPYQTMYQKRRLGALGIEWRPSSTKFAIGPDISLGQDFEMPALEDLERMMEPPPELIDAMYWEPENEVISDDTDSEYNVAEECSTEGERGALCFSSSRGTESSEEDSDVECSHKDGLRRSRRRKYNPEVEVKTSSGRRVKKRCLDEHDGSISGNNRTKNSKSGRKASKKKSSKSKSLRPQRVAAQNARSMMSRITGTSTDGEDEVDLEGDSSNSESFSEDSSIESSDIERNLESIQLMSMKKEQESEDVAWSHELPKSQSNVVNRKRLVLKFSLRDSKKPEAPEATRFLNSDNQINLLDHSGPEGTFDENGNACIKHPGLSCADVELLDHDRIGLADTRQAINTGDYLEEFVGDKENKENKIRWGEVKIRTSMRSRSGDMMPTDVHNENRISTVNGEDGRLGSHAVQDLNRVTMEEFAPDEVHKSLTSEFLSLSDHQLNGSCDKYGNHDSSQTDQVGSVNQSHESKEITPHKLVKLRIRTKAISGDLGSPSKLKSLTVVHDPTCSGGDVRSRDTLSVDHNPGYCMQEIGEGSDRSSSLHLLHSGLNLNKIHGESPYKDKTDSTGLNAINDHDSEIGFSEAAADAVRRTRSMKMKASSQEQHAWNHNLKVRVEHALAGTSTNEDNFSVKAYNDIISEEWMSSSKVRERSRTTRTKRGGDPDNNSKFSSGRKSNPSGRKLSWLMLSEQEEGYRYIPQLGDEVVYFRQGHEECIESGRLKGPGPWSSRGYLSAVEICRVENLAYSHFPGSGESCCKITLKFVDNSSRAFGDAFILTLPELIGFPDFLIEKTRYDAAMRREWTRRDKCLVWWKNDNGEGGSWWDGRIVASQAKSMDFPDSPWERYEVSYKDGCKYRHSAWELHDPNFPWEHPNIDSEIRNRLLFSFAKLDRSVSRNQDFYGFQKLNEAAEKSEFLNRFPVPLYPELIRLRLENNYYRTLEAVKHDINIMLSNAESYFVRSAHLSSKMRRLSDWFTKTLSKL